MKQIVGAIHYHSVQISKVRLPTQKVGLMMVLCTAERIAPICTNKENGSFTVRLKNVRRYLQQ